MKHIAVITGASSGIGKEFVFQISENYHSLDEICYLWDLSKPIWLDNNVNEFKRHDKTRFYADNFIDSIDFDYLEFQVIEEDNFWD